MSDSVSKEKRSEVMSSVHSSGNKSTELRLISLFRELGIKGWRRRYPVKGHPDFVFKNRKIAVFVDGCFWHGHTCRRMPETNYQFWETKIQYNRGHDNNITTLFENRGWVVIRIWECELKKKNRETLMQKLQPIIQR